MSVYAFAAWMVFTNLWANPSYTAAAPYDAGLLLGGFLLGRRASQPGAGQLFLIGLTFVLCAAIWGLWQQLESDEPRAHALFVTPATFSSVLNLLLLPGLILLACGTRGRAFFAILVVLSAGLAAAQARGGLLAFVAAGVCAWALARRARLGIDLRSAAMVGAAFALGCSLAWLLPLLEGSKTTHSMTDALAVLSSVSRLELYALALKSLTPSTLLFGSGFQSFFYILEAGRPSVLSYAESTTYFVHNDYLQILLELGLPGFVAFLAIVIGPLAFAWRAAPQIGDRAERLTLVAAFAAIASMAVHALVDFPFYIPVCLLLCGTAIGIVDAILVSNGRLRPLRWRFAAPRPAVLSAARVGLATIAIWILVVPVVAEAAAEYGNREWKRGRGQSAVLWLEVARRVDPHDWRYHWYVGQFWMVQAEGHGNRVGADLADAAYAKGFQANSREVRNLFDRIYLHRRLRHMLSAPADGPTLRAWAQRTASLAPLDPVVRAQAARVMQEFGSSTARPAP